jgi:hypothetical protein
MGPMTYVQCGKVFVPGKVQIPRIKNIVYVLRISLMTTETTPNMPTYSQARASDRLLY